MDKNETLDPLFHEAALNPPQVDDDLMARLMQDMQDHVPAPAPRRFDWRLILPTLGGWPALAGMATAGIMGVWIGISPPDMMLNASDTLMGDQVLYLDDIYGDGLLGLDLSEEGAS